MSSESRERKLKVCGRVKQPLSVPYFFYFPGNLLRLFRSHKRIIIKLIPQVKSLSGLLWRKKCTWPFFLNLCQLCSTALCIIGDQEKNSFNFAAWVSKQIMCTEVKIFLCPNRQSNFYLIYISCTLVESSWTIFKNYFN